MNTHVWAMRDLSALVARINKRVHGGAGLTCRFAGRSSRIKFFVIDPHEKIVAELVVLPDTSEAHIRVWDESRIHEEDISDFEKLSRIRFNATAVFSSVK